MIEAVMIVSAYEKGSDFRHHRSGRRFLTEFLLAKGYEVHGLMRRASTFNTDRIEHLYHDPHDPVTAFFCITAIWPTASGLRHVSRRSSRMRFIISARNPTCA